MKQPIILTLCLMISSLLQGQSYCNPNGITTNPDAPVNNHNPSFQNTFFDWRVDLNATPPVTTYEQYFNPIYTHPNHPAYFPYWYSPFWAYFDYLDAISGYKENDVNVIDYHPEDGWEVITRGMGRLKDGSNFIGFYCPYLILYNKYQGKFRVFFALPSINISGQTSKIKVVMTFNNKNGSDENAPVNGLFGHNAPTSQPLDKETTVTRVSGVTRYNANAWHYTDIAVAYDACACKGETSIQVDFEMSEIGDIILTGGVLGTETTLGTNTNFFKNNMLLNIVNEGTQDQVGVQTYSSLADRLSNYNAGDNGITTAVEIIGQITGAFDYLYPMLDAFYPKFNTNPAQYDAAKKKYKEDLGLVSRTLKYGTSLLKPLGKKKTLPTVIQAEVALTGQVETSNSITTAVFVFDTPGTSASTNNTELGISSYPSYPFYNEVLGKFAVLKTPKIKASGTIYQNGWKSSTYRKYQFDETSLEYVYNPAVGVNEAKTTILAALVFESSTDTSQFIYNDAYDDFFPPNFSLYEEGVFLNQRIEDGIAPHIDKEIYRTPYMPLECLGNYTVTFMTDTSGIGANNIKFQYTRPVTPYLQLIIFYEFNALGRDGEPIKDIQILTYPLDKVGTPLQEYNDALPFEKTISATNFTQSQVIQAIGTITVNGDLTTSSGVEVDIIANSIVLSDGVEIGSGINLISGTPNVCGTKIPTSAINLTSYCHSNDYKADVRKNLPLIQPPTKPKEEGNFSLIAYPNPFEDYTTIAFSLENPENVTLKLYNALGIEVETILKHEALSAGNYKRVTQSNLHHGVYFAVLRTDTAQQTIKIVKY